MSGRRGHSRGRRHRGGDVELQPGAFVAHDIGEEGATSPMAPNIFIAEFIATFTLCFAIIACRGNTGFQLDGSQEPYDDAPKGALIGVAIVHAFVLAASAAAYGPICGGHMNPAVTVAFMVTREIDLVVGALFMVLQLIAGIAAGAVAYLVVPGGVEGAAPYFAQGNLPGKADHGHAFFSEFLGVFFLVMTIFCAGVSGAASHSAFIAIGFALGFGVLFGGPISNACFNPARALGAAVVSPNYDWSQFWLYIVAPVLAALIAGIIWGVFFQKASDGSKHGDCREAWGAN